MVQNNKVPQRWNLRRRIIGDRFHRAEFSATISPTAVKSAVASASFGRETIAAINTGAACISTLLHELRIAKRARHWNSNCEQQGRRYAAARSWTLRE